MARELLFRPRKPLSPGRLSISPTVLWFDTGGTTGWSVMQVHPEALSEPDVKILDNIEYWAHGQIDCGSKKGNAGESNALPAAEVQAEINNYYKSDLVGDRFKSVEFSEDGVSIDDGGSGSILVDGIRSIMGAESLGVSITGECAGASEMLSLVVAWEGCAVGKEDYILRKASMGREILAPVRVNAAFDFGLWMLGIESHLQQPSLAKTAATDDKLKAWGLYRREGGMQHARDADRHAITFLRRCKDLRNGNALRSKAWPHIYGTIPMANDEEYVGPYYVEPPKRKRAPANL